MLPLHHALEKLASEAVVAALLAAYPEAAKEKDEVSGRAARPTAPLPLPLRTLPLTLTRTIKVAAGHAEAAGQFADQASTAASTAQSAVQQSVGSLQRQLMATTHQMQRNEIERQQLGEPSAMPMSSAPSTSRESAPSRSSAHLGIVIDGDFPDFDEDNFKSKLAKLLQNEITRQDISIQPRVGRASSVVSVRTGSCEVLVSCSISGRADTSEDAEDDEADRIEAVLKQLIEKLWPGDVTTREIRVMVSMSG